MKRIFALTLITAICLSLFGCSQKEQKIYMDILAEKGWESDEFSQPRLRMGLELFEEEVDDYNGKSVDLTKYNLTANEYKWLSFDEQTKFPDEGMPEWFDPESEIELGKDPGFGIRELHKKGITGKGVNIGIVDQELHLHEEYKGKIRYYYNANEMRHDASMHGPAVTSLAVGETCGTAPDANVYYACCIWNDYEDGTEEFYKTFFFDSINHLLDLNETLPEEDKMVAISVSRYFDETIEGYQQVVERAEEQGVWLVTVNEVGRYFGSLTREIGVSYDTVEGVKSIFSDEKLPGIPKDRRTYATPINNTGYEYSAKGGVSWVEPYVAGVYALAKQVCPKVTVDEFTTLARQKMNVRKEDGEIVAYMLNMAAIIEELESMYSKILEA